MYITKEDFERICRIIVVLGETHRVMLKYLDDCESEVDKDILNKLLISNLGAYDTFREYAENL